MKDIWSYIGQIVVASSVLFVLFRMGRGMWRLSAHVTDNPKVNLPDTHVDAHDVYEEIGNKAVQSLIECHQQLTFILLEQKTQTKKLNLIADTMDETLRTQRRIARSFSGASYEEVTPAREREEDKINDLIDRYGMDRDEATARVRSESVYTREDLGLRRRS